jgi:hypothetical protein
MNRRLGGTYRFHHQGDKNRRARNHVSSNYEPKHAAKKHYVVPSSPILVTLIMETILCSETSVLTQAIRRNMPEDGILHSPSSPNAEFITTSDISVP